VRILIIFCIFFISQNLLAKKLTQLIRTKDGVYKICGRNNPAICFPESQFRKGIDDYSRDYFGSAFLNKRDREEAKDHHMRVDELYKDAIEIAKSENTLYDQLAGIKKNIYKENQALKKEEKKLARINRNITDQENQDLYGDNSFDFAFYSNSSSTLPKEAQESEERVNKIKEKIKKLERTRINEEVNTPDELLDMALSTSLNTTIANKKNNKNENREKLLRKLFAKALVKADVKTKIYNIKSDIDNYEDRVDNLEKAYQGSLLAAYMQRKLKKLEDKLETGFCKAQKLCAEGDVNTVVDTLLTTDKDFKLDEVKNKTYKRRTNSGSN
jgi:hypothetical protein